MADIEEISKPKLEGEGSASSFGGSSGCHRGDHSQHTTYRRDHRDEVGVVHFGELHDDGLVIEVMPVEFQWTSETRCRRIRPEDRVADCVNTVS